MFFGQLLDPRDFALAALSAALHVVYLLLLLASYQVADLSRAYPLSRGTGVALVALASVCCRARRWARTSWSAPHWSSLGLVGVTLAGPPLTRADRRGIATALGTGVAIAGYTIVDGLAVSGGAPVLAYAGWLMFLQSWVLPLCAVIAPRPRASPRSPVRRRFAGLGGGVVSLLGVRAGAARPDQWRAGRVAALRELSIGLGVLIGAFVLHEAAARKRLLPALVLTAGAVRRWRLSIWRDR